MVMAHPQVKSESPKAATTPAWKPCCFHLQAHRRGPIAVEGHPELDQVGLQSCSHTGSLRPSTTRSLLVSSEASDLLPTTRNQQKSVVDGALFCSRRQLTKTLVS